jgi:HEAT repeat protein
LWLVLLLTAPSPAFAIWVTLGLLVVDAAVCLRVLICDKRVPVLLNLTQLALFTVAHYLVFSVWGKQNYIYDREPWMLDWLQFTGAHVIRAVDVLDFIEEYGIDLQNIKHNSTVAGFLLVAMHLTVDVFLLGLVLRFAKKVWLSINEVRQKRRQASPAAVSALFRAEKRSGRFARILARGKMICLVVCVLFIVVLAYLQQWKAADWLLWPLDTIVRLIDVGDMMQVFAWRLHTVEQSYPVATLAVLTRVLTGFYILGWLNYAHLVLLQNLALRTIEEYARDLLDKNIGIRKLTADVLGRIGPHASAAVPALIRTLADRDPDVRRAAKEALGKVDPNWPQAPQAGSAVPALVQALADRDPDVRWAAEEALGKVDPNWPQAPQAGSAAPALAQALADRDPDVRTEAARTLGRIGPQAGSAVPALIRTLADINWNVRRAAEEALGKVDPNWPQGPQAGSAVPALAQALAGRAPGVRRGEAARTLGRIGPQAGSAVPALAQALADRDPDVRRPAEEALGKVDPNWPQGPQAGSAVPALIRTLADSDPDVRRAVAGILGRIGPQAGSAVPALAQALADRDPDVRRAAEEALKKVEPG